jgi:hypothetical protein
MTLTNQYFHEEKYGFLVVQAFDETCYRFNLKCQDEQASVLKIIQDENYFIVDGWKVAQKLPKRVRDSQVWNVFMNEKCSGNSPSIDYSLHDDDNDECQNEDNNDDSDDNKEKNDDKEKDDDADRNDDDYDKGGEDDDGDHDNGSDDGDDEGETKVEKMKYKEMSKAVEIPKTELCSLARKEVLPIKSANDDAQFDIFKSICGGGLKKKFSDNVGKTFKSKSVHVHIT